MSYQDRADIDRLLQMIEELKYFVGMDTDKELATVEALDSLANELKINYYDKTETYSKEDLKIELASKSTPVTLTFDDNSTLDVYLIDEDFFDAD